MAVLPDRFEDNDTRATAYDLGEPIGIYEYYGLTIESNDEDWYQFSTTETAQFDREIYIEYNQRDSNIALQLFNGIEKKIGSSDTKEGNKKIYLQ